MSWGLAIIAFGAGVMSYGLFYLRYHKPDYRGGTMRREKRGFALSALFGLLCAVSAYLSPYAAVGVILVLAAHIITVHVSGVFARRNPGRLKKERAFILSMTALLVCFLVLNLTSANS